MARFLPDIAVKTDGVPEALPLAGGPNATFEGKPLLGG